MKATSATKICNLALLLLGEPPITNLTGPSPKSKSTSACDEWYDTCRRELLELCCWNFAIERKKLPLLNATPAFGYSYKYKLPAEFLKLVAIQDSDETGLNSIDFKIEGDELLYDNANGDPIEVRYVYDIEDVSKFSATFVTALVTSLAFRICIAINGSKTLYDRLGAEKDNLINTAKTMDVKQNPPKVIQRSHLISQKRSLIPSPNIGVVFNG